jgi:WD40 repeat protein
VHPNGRYVASAQTAAEINGKKGRPFVCIWDSDTLEVLAQISYHERHISAVAFSACGTRLMTVGGDADHTFAMWSWETEVEVPAMEYPGSKDEIFGIKFSNHSFTEFVTYGVKHLRFWTLKEVPLCVGSKLLKFAVDSRPAFLYEKAALPSAFHCVLYHKDMLLAGTHNGDIMVFTAHHLESVIQAHDTHPVSAIAAMPNGGFVTGGFDGRIKVWTEDMVPVQDGSVNYYICLLF